MVLLAGNLPRRPPPLEMLHKPKQNLEEEVLSWSIHDTLIQESLTFIVMYITDYPGFIYLFLLLFLLTTGGSVLWLSPHFG